MKTNSKGRDFPYRVHISIMQIFALFVVVVGVLSNSTIVSAQCTMLNENFNSAPTLNNTDVNGAWYPDRYRPAAFVNDANRLKISIDGTNDAAAARPPGYSGSFYNTQGRKFNQCGSCVKRLKGSLYIPTSWATAHRRTDMWATAFDNTNAVSFYPIIGFRNVDGASPNLSYWDGSGWVNTGAPAAYDTWYDLEFELIGTNVVYKINGSTVGTVASSGSTYLGNIIMQAYNFNDAALGALQSTDSYDAYWDNLQTTGANGNVVTNTNTGLSYCSIQGAVNAATPGDVITVGAGTYNEAVTVNKSLTLQGATSNRALYVLNGTGLSGNNNGITISSGITNVTIKNLTVQNYTGASGNANAGVYGIGMNNNLTIDNVALLNNPNASGFYANGPVDAVSVTNSRAENNGGGARGMVIWNGAKTNITFTGNTVVNNVCCGIELQDGTASGVNVSNNTIDVGAGDNAIGLVGLNTTISSNTVNNNTITGGGRFGIEIKNPEAGVTISGNSVSLTSQNADVRDRAGISVVRRSKLAGNVDVPNGVAVTGNTVIGYQQSSTSEGFGIVIEGTNHVVTGNTVTNCEVGILQQQNPSNYPNDADQSNIADQYFGRGNSPITCGNTISSNTFSGNGTDTRNIGAGTGIITNTNTGRQFCSIQAAINDSYTMNGNTIVVAAGTYNESLNITKAIALVGPNATTDCAGTRSAEATITGTGGANNVAVKIASDNVSVSGFTITNPMGSYGVSAQGRSNLVVNYNIITNIGDNATGTGPSYGVQIESNATASNVAITNNCVSNIRGGQNGPTSSSNGSGVGIGANSSNSNFDLSGLNIANNRISSVSACTTNGTGGKGAYGVIINVGAQTVAVGQAVNAVVTGNEISNCNGRWVHGIGLEGDTPGALVANNSFSNFTAAATDNTCVHVEQNDGAASVAINNNSFGTSGFGVTNVTAITNVNATCNWFGSIVPATVAARVWGSFTFVPFLSSGTDNSAAVGFQPVPASCSSGAPYMTAVVNTVSVSSDGDGNPNTGAFSVCNIPNNINFGTLSASPYNHPLYKVYQSYSTANVTTPLCNGCSATMAAFSGVNVTAALVNPANNGTLTLSLRGWIDLDNNGSIDAGEPTDDVLTYTITVNPRPVLSVAASTADFCPGVLVSATVSNTGGDLQSPLTYSWSDGVNNVGSTANIQVSPASTTTYTVTVSDGRCSNTGSVSVNPLDYAATYRMLAATGISLTRSTVNGNAGVTGGAGSINAATNSVINGTARAATINLNTGSTATTQVATASTASYPTFLSSDDCSNAGATVIPASGRVTLTGTNYGAITIGQSAQVRFSQPNVSIRSITTSPRAVVIFEADATVRVCEGVTLNVQNAFNTSTTRRVKLYTNTFSVNYGSTVRSNIYANTSVTAITAGSLAPTGINGMIVSNGTVTSGAYVTWNAGVGCVNNMSKDIAADDILPDNMTEDELATYADVASVDVYPNPATTDVIISLMGLGKGSHTLQVTDILGRQITSSTISAQVGSVTVSLDPTMYPSGTYMVTVDSENGRVTKVFSVVR